MKTKDTKSAYGSISIALHWLTAAIVIVMFTVGSLIHARHEINLSELHLHTTIGMTVYIFLWGRIIWRFAVGHPGRLPEQSAFFFTIGKCFHFMLLMAIALMLLSGPLMVWANGGAIEFFQFTIPGPAFPWASELLQRVHSSTATFLLTGVFFHVLAVIKHAAIDGDGTFEKIMIAGGEKTEQRG